VSIARRNTSDGNPPVDDCVVTHNDALPLSKNTYQNRNTLLEHIGRRNGVFLRVLYT